MTRKCIVILIIISTITSQGVAAPPTQVARSSGLFTGGGEPRVIERSSNHRIWERIAIDTSATGRTYEHKHHYTELASGLCYQKDGAWVDADPQIVVAGDGSGVGQDAENSARFLPDINSDGSVLLTTKTGKELRSHVLGICYYDSKTLQSVQIGSIKSTAGNLVGKTQLVYSDAFEGVTADVQYEYKKSGLSQNIVFRSGLPALPANMDPAATRVEIWTEFLNPPQFSTKSIGDSSSAETFQDEIKFGDVRIGRGTAFKTMNRRNQSGGISVKKQWLQIQGRTFLIESVPYNNILRQTSELPRPPQAALDEKCPTAPPALRRPPTRRMADTTKAKKIQMADAAPQSPGFVVDYEVVPDNNDEYTFRSDTTYYVSDTVYAGAITIEGNAVIKFAPGALGINVLGTQSSPSGVTCLTGPYRPAVFTSQDDDSVGEQISNSGGYPFPYEDAVGLNLGSQTPPDLHDLRFTFLYGAISENSGLSVTSVQFTHCSLPLSMNQDGAIWIRNCLFDTFDTMIDGSELDAPNVNFENITADNGSAIFGAEFGSAPNPSLWGYNNLLANVVAMCEHDITDGLNGGHNAFYNAPQFGSAQHVLNSDPFQSAGTGNFYLKSGAGLRDAGDAVDNDPTLLNILKTKTTFPPAVHVSESLDDETPYTTTAPLDLSQGSTDTPDIGYHYDVIDHVFAGCEAMVDITFAAGTVVAWYRIDSGYCPAGHGIHLDDRKICTFAGTYEKPCYWVRANTVQEGSAGEPYSYGNGGITGSADQSQQDPTISPEVHLTFTRCSEMANESTAYFADDCGYLKVYANHCELYSGYIGTYGISFAMTNCLLYEATVRNFEGWTGTFAYLRNCTFANHGALILVPWYEQPDILVEDCIFEETDIEQQRFGLNGVFDYNAYQHDDDQRLGTGQDFHISPHDQIEIVNWQTGPAGNFYLPSGSLLTDAGSRTAPDAGLYHFTTKTDQTKEAGTLVDIGYHYVALDADGDPVDSNGDGIPDYVADANGNGVVDPGEIPWAGLVILRQPANFTGPAGSTAIFAVVAKGYSTLSYQWRKNGQNLLNAGNVSGATSSALTISAVSASDVGSYSVKVSSPFESIISTSAQLLILQGMNLPDWVGAASHIWSPQLGGGIWFQERSVIDGIGAAITDYPRPVLIGLRGDTAEQGYRFDLDPTGDGGRSAFANPMAVTDPASQEYVLKTLESTHNVQFMWSMPLPHSYSSTPYDTNAPQGAAYPWQTPAYYAAYLQYLTEPATMTQQQLDNLDMPPGVLPAVDSNGALIPENEQLVHTNWGNLRAKRGSHPAPYAIEFVVLGVEPAGGAQEHYDDGHEYGSQALAFQAAIRDRANQFATTAPGRISVLAATPLGLYAGYDHPIDDAASGGWFYPMLDAVRNGGTIAALDALGFSYLDIHHYYVNNAPSTPEDNARFQPIMINNRSLNCASNDCYRGWQYYWSTAPFPWPGGVDFSKRLWMYEDAVYALDNYTDGQGHYENFSRWHLGCAEHGLRNLSSSENDMGAGIHWALYLAETMRYNATWDLNWVFCEQGHASAQVHVKNGYLTRTPGHYAYKMAQEFYGYEYHSNTFPGTNDAAVGYSQGDGDPGPYIASNIVVRVFRNPADNHFHLFVINKGTASYTIPAIDWTGWNVLKWTQIQADGMGALNPIGEPQPLNAIATQDVTPSYVHGSGIVLPKISINHIELAVATLPPLTIAHTGNQITLSWPTTFAGFKLQSSSALNPGGWIDSTDSPVVNGSNYTVTSLISGRRFFRLSR